MTSDIATDLLTQDELMARLRIGEGVSGHAAWMSFHRVWKRAQDVRHDRGLPRLMKYQIGRKIFYPASTVDELLEALSVE
jgi:hypothetical protein